MSFQKPSIVKSFRLTQKNDKFLIAYLNKKNYGALVKVLINNIDLIKLGLKEYSKNTQQEDMSDRAIACYMDILRYENNV